MPELPDIYLLTRSMDEALRGQRIAAVEVNQPRCLNLPPEEFARAVNGAAFLRAWQRGKWALTALDSGDTLAFNLGMGGEVRLHAADEVASAQRERVTFRLGDGRQLWAHFWWFGQVHLIAGSNLGGHPQLGKLGDEPLAAEFTVHRLAEILNGRRGALKKYLLDQSVIAGIGNVYIQDILWHARLHPLAVPRDLTPEDIARLHGAIQHVLREGIRWGGGPREQDIWGHEGTYTEHLQVGYRTGRPCPACGTPVEEVRVGATTSYVCPQCQRA